MSKIWFITGASRGLGRSLVEAVLADGDLVAAAVRNPNQLDDLAAQYPDHLKIVQLDVTDQKQITAAITHTIEKFGRIDVLVNNAGMGVLGAAEAYSDEQVRNQLETNLHAPIALTRAILPYMRRQGSGRILQISSVGGRIGSPALTVYQAAKFGLTGFSEALAKEVKPLGIWVTSVEPGGLRTSIFADMDTAPEIAGYETSVGQRMAQFKSIGFIAKSDPDKAAKVLLDLAEHPEPPMHLILGSDAVSRIKQADTERNKEMDDWLSVSLSTDADADN
jgi:NAD(P)-dependent dehydrogenase (short-subunit alcohol dehydrogenase family)